MRRILVAGSAVVVLAMAALLAVSVGARTVSARTTPSSLRAARSSSAPHVSPPVGGGHTCFVSVPRCSQTPCVEFINSDGVYRPAVAGVRSASPSRCAPPRPNAKVVNSPSTAPNFNLVLPGLAHRLQARPPRSP